MATLGRRATDGQECPSYAQNLTENGFSSRRIATLGTLSWQAVSCGPTRTGRVETNLGCRPNSTPVIAARRHRDVTEVVRLRWIANRPPIQSPSRSLTTSATFIAGRPNPCDSAVLTAIARLKSSARKPCPPSRRTRPSASPSANAPGNSLASGSRMATLGRRFYSSLPSSFCFFCFCSHSK